METIIVAVLSLIGTLGGAYFSNRRNATLIDYRIKQLEEKVNKHNELIERTYKLEEKVAVIENEMTHIEEQDK